MTFKYLVWDGIYRTRGGDCNSRRRGDPPRPQSLEHRPSLAGQGGYLAPAQFRQALIGLLGTIADTELKLTMLAVSETFLPVRQNMEIKLALSPIDKVEQLLLRIYDRADRPVYEELIDGNDKIKALPGEPPATDIPDRTYAKCANWADGPYRAALWAGAGRIPLRDAAADVGKGRIRLRRAMETEINKDVTAVVHRLDQGQKPQLLEDGRPVGETLDQVYCDMRSLRWHVTGARYDYVIQKAGSKLEVDLFYEPAPTRRLVHDQFSRGKVKVGEPTAVGHNVSEVRLPKIKCAAYEVPTFGIPAHGTAYWLKVALEAWWAGHPRPQDTIASKKAGMIRPRGFWAKLFRRRIPRGKPLETTAPESLLADAEAKVRHLFEHVLHEADTRITGLEPDVQRVFIAPEFYFTHPDRPYTSSEMFTILDELKKRSADYPEWLIVAGSIWWSVPWIEERRKDFSTAATNVPYTKEPKTRKGVKSLLRQAAAAGDRELGILAECRITQAGAELRLNDPPRIRDVRIRKRAASARLEIYHGVVTWKPAYGTSPKTSAPRYANIVYNTVPVLYGGKIIYTQQKNHASTIDGLKGWTDSVKTARTDVAQRITHRQPLWTVEETWNRWIAEIESTQVKVEGQGVFYLNGLMCGVEICLDHLHTVLRDSCANLPSPRAQQGVDLHLLVAAGMNKDDNSVAARRRGVLLRCDGGYPTSRYSSAYRMPPPPPPAGNITELTPTRVPLNNPVSNRIDTEVQGVRDSIDDTRADWRDWNLWGGPNNHVFEGNWYDNTTLPISPADYVKHLHRGHDWEHWNLDPTDSLVIYNELVDING